MRHPPPPPPVLQSGTESGKERIKCWEGTFVHISRVGPCATYRLTNRPKLIVLPAYMETCEKDTRKGCVSVRQRNVKAGHSNFLVLFGKIFK